MLPSSYSQFIKDHITFRQKSLLDFDLEKYKPILSQRITGMSVLVIGGAGTIGSSFTKALLSYKPRRLVIVDTNENGLTELTRDLRSSQGYHIPDDYTTYPINFGDRIFARFLRNEEPFEIVANFAAHKHVRSEKDHYSIEAMIENNVIRTKKLLDLLVERPPEHFFCVSTDKAANPVNVMGASKKMMEEVLLTYSSILPIKTARFANVAFSNGSLLAGFLERLNKRQPFSSPSDVRRYFVSPEESGQLCLFACILGSTGDIFFPKLREEQMITFSSIGDSLLKNLGLTPDYCKSEMEAKEKATKLTSTTQTYPVYYFSTDTSGEKLYEEFYTKKEQVDLKSYQSLGVIKGKAKWTQAKIKSCFAEFENLFGSQDVTKEKIIELMSTFLPNFHHIEKGKGLDQRM